MLFTGSNFEAGEVMKATTLPLDRPESLIEFPEKRFCFTGTFGQSSRSDCELASVARGVTVGGIAKKTDFLVIGVYATDSWTSSSYGRKIEKAVELQNQGCPIAIVSEEHWARHL